MQLQLSLIVLSALALVRAASSPPSGSITVGPSGSGAKYTSLTSALADTSSTVIFVYSGTYTGQHYITRANTVIYGQTSTTKDYTKNTVTFTNSRSAADAGGNDQSGTIRIAAAANNVKLYNINIANTYGSVSNHTQAIALSVYSTGNFAAYGVQLKGIQDTLLAQAGFQFYGKSYISGSTDFIWGQHGSVWITGSTIETVGSGYITASGRESADSAWYVIDKTTVKGTGTVYLGRPWRNYARVVYQNSNLASIIPAAGWIQWSSSTPNTDHVYFGEYNNTGAGAWKSGRASFAQQISSAVSINTVLGSSSWIDSEFL